MSLKNKNSLACMFSVVDLKKFVRKSHRYVDPLLKWVAFDLGLDKLYLAALRSSYKGDQMPLFDFWKEYGFNMLRVCENLYQSRRRKVKTAKIKISTSVKFDNAYFITLTFRDDVLANTNEQTRRKYVCRFLKDISYRYIANVDYGLNTEREHYHAIIDPYPFNFASWDNGKKSYVNVPDLRAWCSDFGFVDIRKVGNLKIDMERVCKYTSKLAFHALKSSTKQGKKVNRIIYSRCLAYKVTPSS